MSNQQLTEEDIEKCQQAFTDLDHEGHGQINVIDLKLALEKIGYNPSDNDLYKMISEVTTNIDLSKILKVDVNNTGTIKFNHFLNIYLKHKASLSEDDDQDTIDAFVSLGGKPDKTGNVDANELIRIIKTEFQMSIDIEALIKEVDEDGSGEIEFDEFKVLLKSGPSSD